MENLDTLFKKLKQGDISVRNTIIESQMGLVYSVAKKYYKIIDKDTAIQEGCIGLIKAVDKFDIDKGFKFSTFAVLCIEGSIKRYLRDTNENFSIRFKRDDYSLLNKMNLAEEQLYAKLKREPTIDELVEYLEVDRESIINVKVLKDTISMDYEVKGDSKSTSTHELIEDATINLEEDVVNKLILEDVLSILNDKERFIIEKHYLEEVSQAEIGKIIGTNQVQVSRIKTKALNKIKESIKNGTIKSSTLKNKYVKKENITKGDKKMSKANNLADLNNILFEQLEKLSNPDLKDKELKEEIERSQAIAKVAAQIINTGSLVLKVKTMQDNDKIKIDNKDTPMLDSTPSKRR